ncbi:hypothetical protein lerEdw1_007527 [Lerista edwardsae]|nr:hypothetical protein lerEdw1_007527 [Lerista edwardsae]
MSGPFRFRPARLRFPAQHRFFEEGDVQRHLRLQELLGGAQDGEREEAEAEAEAPQLQPPPSAPLPPVCCQAPGCGQTFRSLRSYEQHYEARHRESCQACGRVFPSAHLLGLHLLERHGGALFRATAQRQPAFQCLVESCAQKFRSSRERKDHLVRAHQYPPDFCFDQPAKEPGHAKPGRPPPRESAVPMDLPAEASEQGPGDAMETSCSEHPTGDPSRPVKESAAGWPTSQRRLYRARIPPTVCFGQGAPRGFRAWHKGT